MEKAKVRFAKMQGAGNDYIYIDATEEIPANLPLLARQISSRHFGVGSDGLVAIMRSTRADFRMRMFNADGSEAQMCGNASRCIGKYVYEKGLTEKTIVTLETLAGIKTLRLTLVGDKVKSVTVDMGTPTTEPAAIPAASEDGQPVVSKEIDVDGHSYEVTAVGMGNPHGVVIGRPLSDEVVLGDGPKLETADIWPEKANIEFVNVIDSTHIRMRVWERGSGETLACGTGACAAVVACVLNGLTNRRVKVKLPGGELDVWWDSKTDHVFLTGGASYVAEGEYYPESAIEAGIV